MAGIWSPHLIREEAEVNLGVLWKLLKITQLVNDASRIWIRI